MIRTLLLVIVLAAASIVGPGCSTNPATGKSQLNMLSTDQEVAIGEENAPKFLKEYGGQLPDAQVVEYIRDIGKRLAAESERPDLPWEFHVVDSSVINAFALPGGKVFVSRGLIVEMTNEAQIAGVLGHEIGHVTAQHIGQQMTQTAIVQGLVIGVAVGAGLSDSQWGGVLGAGGQVAGTGYLLKFGRDQESQADALGVRYMTKLGYNPVGQIQVMKILEKSMQGGARPPEFLSTHPFPETRIKRLEQLIPKKYPDFNTQGVYTFNEDAFQQNVLAPIRKLPAARHGSKQSDAGRNDSLLMIATCSCGHAH